MLVPSTTLFRSGQYLYVNTGGYYTVSSITNSTTVVLTNLGYTGNAAPAATIVSPKAVSPGGIQGATGATGAQGPTGARERTRLTARHRATSYAVSSGTT